MNLHPFIQQLLAEGYSVGDRIVGRCLLRFPQTLDFIYIKSQQEALWADGLALNLEIYSPGYGTTLIHVVGGHGKTSKPPAWARGLKIGYSIWFSKRKSGL